MSNEHRDKTAGDYIEQRYWGEQGVATGTASNALGLETRRQRDESAKKERESWTNSSSSSSSNSSSDNKVICTELVRQGLMSRADLVLGARYFTDTLSERHMRGYHAWAVPAVQGMRKSSWQTAFWRVLAQARADAIAAHYGDRQRGGIMKSGVLHAFNALCRIVGTFVSEQDWQRIYSSKTPA